MLSPGNFNESQTSTSAEWSQTCHQFEFPEILLATDGFDESLVIGRGGFGKVYKGTLFNGSVDAAIKRLDPMSNQGAEEFWAEVKMLSRLRHCHLVSLIGYCNFEEEMILVYEYMPCGTLEDHLHKLLTPIPWIHRLKICIGAARGLDYLHTGTGIESGVIHRDVKSSNILLHENWAAKISDFGLSKVGPTNQPSTYVNTLVKGTFGYLDPNYFTTGKLTRKSDVYAFGVVLLELLCRKRAVDRSLDEEQWGLASWAQESIKEGKLKHIIENEIRDQISPKCLKEFVRIADWCLQINPKHRPTMAKVVVSLESLLDLQEKTNNSLQAAGKTIIGRMLDMFSFTAKSHNSGNTLHGTKKQLMASKNFAKENMELLLEAKLKTKGGINSGSIKIFQAEELRKATDNYAKDRILGKGWYSSVYKGLLADKRVVAIRWIDILYEEELEYLMDRIVIFGQIQHRNMVQLLGYCLEPEVALLVYEFVSNGTLYDKIHNGTSDQGLFSWDSRLRIAHELAGALAYLHTTAGMSIHGKVMPSKILLDEYDTPKIVHFDTSCIVWVAMRTLLYRKSDFMDPHYLETHERTDKNDVYGFGVLLGELLTRKKVTVWEKPVEDRTLGTYFHNAKRDNRLQEILDSEVIKEATDEQLEAVCDLVCRCLKIHGKYRPSMKQVTMELEKVRKLGKHT